MEAIELNSVTGDLWNEAMRQIFMSNSAKTH